MNDAPLNNSLPNQRVNTPIAIAGITFALGLTSPLASASGNESSWHEFPEAQQHIIVVQGRGEPMRPIVCRRQINGDWQYKVRLKKFAKSAQPSPSPNQSPCQRSPRVPDAYDAYVKGIIDGIKASRAKSVLFFIHGGMNFPGGAARHAAWLIGQDKRSTDFDLSSTGYPIFICWDSPPTGYLEQLAWVRAGRSEQYGRSIAHTAYAIGTLPFHLLADLGRGFTRFPAELSMFMYNDMYSITPTPFSEFKTSSEETEYLNNCTQPNVHVTKQVNIPVGFARFTENTETVLLFPLRTLSLPIINSFGVGAWENMLRHTDTMFDRTDTGTRKHPTPVEVAVERNQTGALAIFFSHLQEENSVSKLPITLVGHSMGAIVSNRIILGYPDLNYRNIVYMGAACTVREFQASVVPYMTKHPRTHFYNLSLHPQCETGEVALSPQNIKLDIAPRGSLLVWLDNIFTRPPAEDVRRLGTFQTAVLASHNFPETIRPNITLKCFDFGGVETHSPLIWHPQHHADFAQSPFWDQGFWKLDPKAPKTAKFAFTNRKNQH